MGHTGGFNAIYRYLKLALISAMSSEYDMASIYFLCAWEGGSFTDFPLTFTYGSSYPRDQKISLGFWPLLNIPIAIIHLAIRKYHQGLCRTIEYTVNQI